MRQQIETQVQNYLSVSRSCRPALTPLQFYALDFQIFSSCSKSVFCTISLALLPVSRILRTRTALAGPKPGIVASSATEALRALLGVWNFSSSLTASFSPTPGTDESTDSCCILMGFSFLIFLNNGPVALPSRRLLFTSVTRNCTVWSAEGVCIIGIRNSVTTVARAS